MAQCFKVSNLRIYVLLRSLSPLNSVTAFSPKYLDITSPGKVFHLCHWNNSFLPSWHLNLKHVYSSLKRRIRSGLTRFLQSSYTIYPTVSEEQKYWKQAARGQKELQRSDARFAGTKVVRNLQLNALPPLVMYYVPALLPVYRDSSSSKPKKHKRPYLSAKTYRKWHWMVFPGSVSRTCIIIFLSSCPQYLNDRITQQSRKHLNSGIYTILKICKKSSASHACFLTMSSFPRLLLLAGLGLQNIKPYGRNGFFQNHRRKELEISITYFLY